MSIEHLDFRPPECVNCGGIVFLVNCRGPLIDFHLENGIAVFDNAFGVCLHCDQIGETGPCENPQPVYETFDAFLADDQPNP